MTNELFGDQFERWQYVSFKVFLCIVFFAGLYKLLDRELNLTELIKKIISFLRGKFWR